MSVIIQRKKGCSVPLQYLEMVTARNTVVQGVAVIGDKGLEVYSQEGTTNPKSIGIVEEHYPDSDAICFFSNDPVKGDKSRLQPYVLMFDKDEKDPLLIGFLDGDFSGISQEGSKQDKIHLMVEKYLIPKISQLYRLSGGDLDKTLEELKSPLEQVGLLATCAENSIITLMTWDGKICSFSKGANENHRQFDWGWVSDHYGFSDKKGEKGGLVKSLAGLLGGTAPAAAQPSKASSIPAQPPPPPKESAEDNEQENEVKPITAVEAGSLRVHKIPPHLKGKDKKNHIRAKLGTVPKGWEAMTEIFVPTLDKDGKPLRGFDKLKEMKVEEKVIEPANLPIETDISTKTIEPPPVPSVLPIISAEAKEKFEVYTKKVLDNKSKAMPSPDQVNKSESRLPSFVEVSPGITALNDVYNWGYTAYLVLVKEHPEHAALLIQDLTYVLASRVGLAKDDKKEVETPSPAPAPSPEPKKDSGLFPKQPPRKVA